jgi:hypothetical protein
MDGIPNCQAAYPYHYADLGDQAESAVSESVSQGCFLVFPVHGTACVSLWRVWLDTMTYQLSSSANFLYMSIGCYRIRYELLYISVILKFL